MKDTGQRIQTEDSANEVAIKVEHVSKTFRLPHNRQNSIKGSLINLVSGGDRTYEKQEVLKDVSFEIKKGEFFGIVGRNGSGKSTLLKMLAGIYKPTAGNITVNGSLTPFIELGVGFNPELTGRENVFLNGALLGFSNKEVEAMYEDIVAFAELERFMDQKLKNYSSGMQVRLAFSIAIRAQSSILLIDEVLAVGDAAFQQKCYDYFDKLKTDKRTIILVTHEMSAVRQFCDRAMLISAGEIVAEGEPDAVAVSYERLNYGSSVEVVEAEKKLKGWLTDENGVRRANYEYGAPIVVNASWGEIDTKVSIVGVVVFRNGEVVFATNTLGQSIDLTAKKAALVLRPNIGEGRYKAKVVIFGRGRRDVVGEVDCPAFSVYHQPKIGERKEEWEGLTYIPNQWEAGNAGKTQ